MHGTKLYISFAETNTANTIKQEKKNKFLKEKIREEGGLPISLVLVASFLEH